MVRIRRINNINNLKNNVPYKREIIPPKKKLKVSSDDEKAIINENETEDFSTRLSQSMKKD